MLTIDKRRPSCFLEWMVQDHLDLVCVCAVLRMDQAGMDDDDDDTQAWSFDTRLNCVWNNIITIVSWKHIGHVPSKELVAAAADFKVE